MATQLDYPIPQRPSTTQLLTAFNSASVRWPSALRAGLAILIPGAIALLTGHDYAILLISTGAFTVIFGEGHPIAPARASCSPPAPHSLPSRPWACW